jgi:hypothetical protein
VLSQSTNVQLNRVDARIDTVSRDVVGLRSDLGALGGQVQENQKQAMQASAGAMALANAASSAPASVREGEVTGGMALASVGGQTAISAAVKTTLDGQTYQAGLSTGINGTVAVTVGFGFHF